MLTHSRYEGPNAVLDLGAGDHNAPVRARERARQGARSPRRSKLSAVTSLANHMADPDGSAMSSSEERTWSVLVHAAAFVGVLVPIIGGILGPFLVWILKKPESDVVDRHGKAALNFQISMLIYASAGALLIRAGVGLVILIVLGIFWFVMVLVATIRTANGRDPGYVFSISFLK